MKVKLILIIALLFTINVYSQDTIPKNYKIGVNFDLYHLSKKLTKTDKNLFGLGVAIGKPLYQKKILIEGITGLSLFNPGNGNHFNIPFVIKTWFPIFSSTDFYLGGTVDLGLRHFISLPDYITKKTVFDYGFGVTIGVPIRIPSWPYPAPIHFSIKRMGNWNYIIFSIPVF